MKRVLSFIWNEFIYGGHLTALGAPGIALVTSFVINKGITWPFLIIMYLLVEIIYLLDRIRDDKKDLLTNCDRNKNNHEKNLIFPIIYFFVLLFFIVEFSSKIFFISLFFYLFIGFTYSKLAKPFSKKIISFKNYVVITMWSTIPILFIIYYNYPFSRGLLLFVFFLIIREIVNTWYCDIKDIESDKLSGIKTYASKYGKHRSLKILIFINILSMFPIFLGIILKDFEISMFLLILSVIYSIFYIFRANERNLKGSYFLFAIVPDIEPLTYPLALLIGKWLWFPI